MTKNTSGKWELEADYIGGSYVVKCEGEYIASTLDREHAEQIVQDHNTQASLLEACTHAHDALLSLHVCDQDIPRADQLRNELHKAIADTEH